MKRRSRLVRASNLPPAFEIATTWHERAVAQSERIGRRVRVSCMGAVLYLRLSQRVRVLRVPS